MPKLLSGFIAKQIAKNIGPQVKPATLIKVTNGQRIPGQVSSGTNPVETSYAARGFVEAFTIRLFDGTLVQTDDKKISLLGGTIAGGQVPIVGDKVTIEGGTYRITGILERDPDGAMYVVQATQ